MDMTEAVAKLTALAAEVNRESDAYTKALEDVEESLSALNLGVEAWTPPRGAAKIELGYGRTPHGWRLLVTWEGEPPVPLLQARRDVRIVAAVAIGELLTVLTENSKELTVRLKMATDLVKEVLG